MSEICFTARDCGTRPIAYSLGLAYYSLGQYEEAVQAYKDGLKLDPSNVAMKQSLERAEQHISGAVKSAATPAAAPTGAAANPFAGLGGGAGGMPDIGALLNNPALMGMAQSMMQNPQMASMYNEWGSVSDRSVLHIRASTYIYMRQCRMQGLMGAGGGGGVGMPDLSSLMSNPQVQQM